MCVLIMTDTDMQLLSDAIRTCKRARAYSEVPEMLIQYRRCNQHVRIYGPRTPEVRAYGKGLNSLVSCSLCGWAAWAPTGMRMRSEFMLRNPTTEELDSQGYHIAVNTSEEPHVRWGVFHYACARIVEEWARGEMAADELASLLTEFLDSKEYVYKVPVPENEIPSHGQHADDDYNDPATAYDRDPLWGL